MDTLFSLIYFNVIFLATPTFDSSSCCGRVLPRTNHIFVIVLCIYVVVHAFFIINDGFLSYSSILFTRASEY